MPNPKNSSGFSLIEALFATAALAFAIVPAISALSSHIASVHHLEAETASWMHFENLYADAERKLLFADDDIEGSVVITEYANLSTTKPEKNRSGNFDLMGISCKVISREGNTIEAKTRAFKPISN